MQVCSSAITTQVSTVAGFNEPLWYFTQNERLSRTLLRDCVVRDSKQNQTHSYLAMYWHMSPCYLWKCCSQDLELFELESTGPRYLPIPTTRHTGTSSLQLLNYSLNHSIEPFLATTADNHPMRVKVSFRRKAGTNINTRLIIDI